MPRWMDAGRVTFKYGLGDEFIGVLKTIHQLGLDRPSRSTSAGSPSRRATSLPPASPIPPHSAT